MTEGATAGAAEVGRLGGVGVVVSELVEGGVVVGTLVAAAGPDLHLVERGGRRLVVDTRLLGGWQLEAWGWRTERRRTWCPPCR